MNFKRCIDLCFHSGHYLSSSYLYRWARICERSRAPAHALFGSQCSVGMTSGSRAWHLRMQMFNYYEWGDRDIQREDKRLIPFFTRNASRTSSSASNSNDTQKTKTKMHLLKSYFWAQCILLRCSWGQWFFSPIWQKAPCFWRSRSISVEVNLADIKANIR